MHEKEAMSGSLSILAKNRAHAAGLGSSTNAVKYQNQDFEALRNKCLTSNQLFCDPTFPAAPESLGFRELGPKSYYTRGVQWKRPKELVSDPKFIIGGATRMDICQGNIGDCWLLAAIASLTLNGDILAHVIYPDQSFSKDYAGIFHFRLWQYGQWVEVVIDDLLPVKNGKLMFVQSVDQNEFWSALLEKAYAKVNGSYEALKGGQAIEGFEDFTGGIAENYKLSEAPPNLYNIMKQALRRGSLLSTFIYGNFNEMEAKTEDKLVKLHAYSITAAEEVHVDGNVVQLLRIRNPWGNTEWNGAWSDNSEEWNLILPLEKARLNYCAEDGEFWMAYSDFKEQYSEVEICNLTPDAASRVSATQWTHHQFEGSWTIGCTAGGSENNTDTFWKNPLYRITLLEEGDDTVDGNILVALMQKNRRSLHKEGQGLYQIGFSIYKVPEELYGTQCLQWKDEVYLGLPCSERSGIFRSQREVSARYRLPPGDYIIVPSTLEAEQEANFILRVFTEKQSDIKDVDNEVSFVLNDEREITAQDIDDSFKNLFAQISGQDKVVSADELRGFLNIYITRIQGLKTDGFTLETCRYMVDLFDDDGSACLDLVEFQILWNKIKNWLDIFLKFDLDKSGNMNSYEMRLALEAAGFTPNNMVNQLLVARYANNGVVDFNNFVSCLVKLETNLKTFKQLDRDGTGYVKLNLAEWLQLTCG
ncbi:calpain-1 catalytic subunit-like [Hoplias malabaricus]|uniref:calpain-1 catalytic subunit-like n=1 Tax=Hoplias malabaricus TaxID=27720 RepID=UPI0034621483